MFSLKHLFFTLLAVNFVFLLVFFVSVQNDSTGLVPTTTLHTNNAPAPAKGTKGTAVKGVKGATTKEVAKKSDKSEESDVKTTHKERLNIELMQEIQTKLKNVNRLETRISNANNKINELKDRREKVQQVLRWSNPFFLLGAYPQVNLEYFNSYPEGRPFYEKWNYGIINDNDYCEIVDAYNLAHPENMFEENNFFTDYAKNGLARTKVIREIGTDTMKQVSRYMDKKKFYSAQYHLNPTVTNFFTKRVDLHIYHTIGKHFLCATQQYNHIPGHGVLKRKDLIVDSVATYAEQFVGREQCFNKRQFFPFSYRLYIEQECRDFFTEINSAEYQEKLITEPIQYVMKIGFGAHRAMGVFLLDKNETQNRIEEYDNGNKCGLINESLIAQTYITNPLLLDLQNKFDFRVYMLVASTNPLIVYYHDGFLRVSLQTYNKHSTDKDVHLTNTHLSKDTFALAKEKNITFHGMNEEQLRNYQMWTFDKLADYLRSVNRITDDKWVDNYLRPAFYRAFIHSARMSAYAFWKQSNVYEMFGLDFMLDDELNLWFIECNASPQLIGTNELKTNFLVTMLKDLFQIQTGLYRSRMLRILKVVQEMKSEAAKLHSINYDEYGQRYKEAAKNRFEPGYEPAANNSFKLILDENRDGVDAFMGYLPEECL